MGMRRRVMAAAAAAGLAVSGLALGVGAQPAAGASTPVCKGAVVGWAGNGSLIVRTFRNNRVTHEAKSDPLNYKIQHMTWYDTKSKGDAAYLYATAFSAKGRPRDLRIRLKDDSDTVKVSQVRQYQRPLSARAISNSGRYYVYGVQNGKLYRWTRFRTGNGGRVFGARVFVTGGMAKLSALRMTEVREVSGGKADVLIGATGAGQLKQFVIPWEKPGSAKVYTVAKKGFGKYAEMSVGYCGGKANYIGLVMVDRKHNVARLYELKRGINPKRKDLDFRGVLGKGEYWRLRGVV